MDGITIGALVVLTAFAILLFARLLLFGFRALTERINLFFDQEEM
ncbi:MAG: hypothetical protein ABIH84_00180 [bacterium]